jgi:hypothetical protein
VEHISSAVTRDDLDPGVLVGVLEFGSLGKSLSDFLTSKEKALRIDKFFSCM